MKPFHDENVWPEPESEPGTDPEVEKAAHRVVDTAILLTRFIRRAVRSHPPAELSLSAVRALSYIHGTPGVSVSELAAYLLVGAPTASKLVDELEERELVVREADPEDRRRLSLRATPGADRVLATVARPVRSEVARLLAPLSIRERASVVEGMEILRGRLLPEPGPVEDDRG